MEKVSVFQVGKILKTNFILVLLTIIMCNYINAEEWGWSKYNLPESKLMTCIPDTRGKDDSWWIPYFQKKLEQPRKDLLFIGDSITDLWTYPANHKYPGGLETWNKKYNKIATNFGITGDKTQTVLWRLTEGGSLEEYYPRHIVILIGINNLLQNDSPEDTFAGIKTIVEYLRKIRPEAKIMLLGIFPCFNGPNALIRKKIKLTNEKIKQLADYENIYFVDIGNVFLEKDGSVSNKIMRDLLHLSPRGYEIWANTMQPYLEAFLDDGKYPEIWKRDRYSKNTSEIKIKEPVQVF